MTIEATQPTTVGRKEAEHPAHVLDNAAAVERTSAPAEYVTDPSGVVHLGYFPWRTISHHDMPRTLCGIVTGWVDEGWEWGDQTVSGDGATCTGCRRIY